MNKASETLESVYASTNITSAAYTVCVGQSTKLTLPIFLETHFIDILDLVLLEDLAGLTKPRLQTNKDRDVLTSSHELDSGQMILEYTLQGGSSTHRRH